MWFDGIFRFCSIQKDWILKNWRFQKLLHSGFVFNWSFSCFTLHMPISQEIPKPPCCLKSHQPVTIGWLASSTLTDFCLRFSSCKQEGLYLVVCQIQPAGFPTLKWWTRSDMVLIGVFVLFRGRGKPPKNTPPSFINCTWDTFLGSKINPSFSIEKCLVHRFPRDYCLAILNCWVFGDFTCQFYGCM